MRTAILALTALLLLGLGACSAGFNPGTPQGSAYLSGSGGGGGAGGAGGGMGGGGNGGSGY